MRGRSTGGAWLWIPLALAGAALLSGCVGPGEAESLPDSNHAVARGDESGGHYAGPRVPFLNACGEAHAPALPMVLHENGPAWFQLFQTVGADGMGDVYVSWHLESQFFKPERWEFAADLRDFQNGGLQVHERFESAECLLVGRMPEDFQVHIEGGVGAWSETSRCAVSTHYKSENKRFEFTINEPGGSRHGPYPWHSLFHCQSDGAKFIVESIFRGQPDTRPCLSCLLDPYEPYPQETD